MLVTNDGNDERAIKTRIALGWVAINKKLDLLRSKSFVNEKQIKVSRNL